MDTAVMDTTARGFGNKTLVYVFQVKKKLQFELYY